MAILNRTQTSGCKMREKIPNVERCNFAGREKPLVVRSKNANREDILELVVIWTRLERRFRGWVLDEETGEYVKPESSIGDFETSSSEEGIDAPGVWETQYGFLERLEGSVDNDA